MFLGQPFGGYQSQPNGVKGTTFHLMWSRLSSSTVESDQFSTVVKRETSMFLALREIRFATGRFALMGSVVALISLLLVMLSGLTAGLADQNTSAISALETDTLAFSTEDQAEASFTESQVTEDQLAAWQQTAGVESAEPLGITQTRAEPANDGTGATSAAIFGVDPEGQLAPSGELSDGQTLISEEVAAELDVGPGDSLILGGTELMVAEITTDQWYSHTPVVWTTQQDWAELSHLSDPEVVGTVIAATHAESVDAQNVREDADDAATTLGMSPTDSFSALASYSSENGALTMIQALLYGISALVIVAFITVWTVQRTRDIAVLKALGAAEGYVLRDALGQAIVVLSAGAVLGGALGVGGGFLAGQAAPFDLSTTTTVLPVLGVVILGLGGATLAVRRSTRVDPLLALGGS